MTTELNDQNEILSGVISITRDQLSRAMALNAELEVLLGIERKKVKDLEKTVSDLQPKKDSGKNDAGS
jgi:hypothetical protein